MLFCVLDFATHVIGGALGQGLDHKVAHAYTFLCLNYEPGDRIFIFGFSRGAYTARSLAGLLRWAWILKRENASLAGHAMDLYRSHPAKDDDPTEEQAFQDRMKAFRDAYAFPSEAFLEDRPYDPDDPATLTPPDQTCAWIQYVGVWDTVGSLGIPDNLPLASNLNAQYQFYDTSLSRTVRSARHAVSIDEKRKTFTPTLWTNITGLNAGRAPNLARELQPYQQSWFPGGHGAVGGGGDDGGISIPPMLWIAEGAKRAGLEFDETRLRAYEPLAHPDAAFQPEIWSVGSIILRAVGMEDRKGPADYDDVSLSARLRHAKLDYAPPPLQAPAVLEGLGGFAMPAGLPVFYNP